MREQATHTTCDVQALILDLCALCRACWAAGKHDSSFELLLVIEGLAKRIP